MKRINSRVFTLLATGLLITSVVQAQVTYRWTDKDGKVSYSDQPPPPDATNTQQKKLGSGNFVDTSGPSYDTRKATQDFPVALYVSSGCGTGCDIAREFLNRRGIPFSERLIKTVDDAAAFSKATGISEPVVPTLLVGTQVQKGYQEAAWNNLLDAAGYPQEQLPQPGNKTSVNDATTSSSSQSRALR